MEERYDVTSSDEEKCKRLKTIVRPQHGTHAVFAKAEPFSETTQRDACLSLPLVSQFRNEKWTTRQKNSPGERMAGQRRWGLGKTSEDDKKPRAGQRERERERATEGKKGAGVRKTLIAVYSGFCLGKTINNYTFFPTVSLPFWPAFIAFGAGLCKFCVPQKRFSSEKRGMKSRPPFY